ncbi:LysR substrate-binding domain-containing protein [Gluconacetobacter takamatsuzukensis]|uniref:LysR family transcriptional regulator n=1 Tax=Gluconacetobacter takamatsuzukensis TaxID=1286190 RepID=A0A7W4KDK6_9PROT|nr:LysR substrate-binding domain-containing protein [Gluconacetobacter takamatsuzukensis]MBB2204961.1 LysR family transcriptional regulator [Gluconacetobacter takamatsuzukensis]
MIYDEVGDLRFFVMLAEAQSMTKAARGMGTSPAVISRRLARLEGRLGSCLVNRSTRRFKLSETGQILYERALRIVTDITDLEAEISSAERMPQGSLNVGAPLELGRRLIAPFVESFNERYPELKIGLALVSEGRHEFGDCLDLIVRLGMPDMPTAIVTHLASTTRILCASPAYLARVPAPATLRDLAEHDCLCLRRSKSMTLVNRWAFGDEENREVVTVQPRLSSTSCEVIHDWALSGQGIAYKLMCDVHDDLKSGKLVHVLPELSGEGIDFYALRPHRQGARANVDVFLRELRAYLRRCGGFSYRAA